MNTKEKNNIPTDAHITIDETGMPIDAYITIKCNEEGKVEIYVGGKPVTTYHGQNIYDIPYIKEVFAWMQAQNPDIEEFHIGTFATRGDKMGQTGNPSSVFGPHAWCRLKFKNGKYGSWVFDYTRSSAADCANVCAAHCAYNVRNDPDFYARVLNASIDKTSQPGKTTGSAHDVGLMLGKKSQQRTK